MNLVSNTFLILILSFSYIHQCSAHCPNMCSKHGTCGTDNTCTCADGYSGLDCSLIPCATGVAWTDKAQSSDSAHQAVECSNAGICNLSTGKCKCFSGYSGTACQRISCPNDCNGRGRCMSIRDVSVYYGRDYDSSTAVAGDGSGFDYDAWDARSMQMCKCDYGYAGPDCSLVLCPKGDDPFTTGQDYRTIKLTVSTWPGRTFFGDLGVSFHGEISYISLDSPTHRDCTATLKLSPQYQDLSCTYFTDGAKMFFTISFISWPRAPKQNNLYSHDGNPPISDFYCDISNSDSSTQCLFEDVSASNIKEYEFCSNRGMCNFDTGDCKCVDGFGGMACENITNRFSDDSNALVARQVIVNNPTDYLSTAVRINVQKYGNTDFQHIAATANTTKHFEVRGDGQLGVTELRVLDSGITIARGGLQVESGGFTVATDGAYVYSHSDTVSGLDASSTSTVFTDDALEIKSESTTPANTYFLRVYNRDDDKFSVRGDGRVNMDGVGTQVTGGVSVVSEGLAVSGGISVRDSGIKVTGGFTIMSTGWYTTNGITVPQNGLQTTGGATIYGGLSVVAGGIAITAGGSDISENGLLISQDGATVASGGLKATDGVTINNDGLQVTAGVSIITGGMKVTGGITVHDNGFVGTDGLTIVAGGMKATGGLSITGGAKVTSGITVVTDGLKVALGASIESTGMTSVGGVTVESMGITYGLQVFAGGMKSTGGLTVASSGARITGGLTVVDTGLYVEQSGMCVAQSGMKVADGVTVHDSGVVVSASGVKVTGGFTVGDVGMRALGGMTIANGLEVLADGATIASGGLKVIDGLTVHDTGLFVTSGGIAMTGGMTIQDVGIRVTGGLSIINTGIFVTTDGGTIASGGLAVFSGFEKDELNIEVSGMTITGGLSVLSSGMKVTGGMTFSSTAGLQVAAGGVTVASPGVKVESGITVSTVGVHITGGGVRITGGLTLADTGIKVTGGLSVDNSGLVVTANGVSIVGYMTVEDGVTVGNTGLFVEGGGMKITGGLSVLDSNLVITGGLTVSDTGFFVSSGGGTFTAAGLKVVDGGLTVASSIVRAPNIIVTGAISVVSGAVITGGLTVTNTGLKVDAATTNYITGTSDIIGDLSISNNLNGNVVTPSDRRLKHNITPVRGGLDSVSKLRGVYFKWAPDSPQSKFHKKRQMGLIAQDVQMVFPELIADIMDGDFLGVNYLQLLPVLIEAIRELDELYSQLDDDYRQLGVRSQKCACRNKNYSF